MSNGEEGIGNAVVIGLIPSTQGLYLSPEGLRYIIVLFLSGWSAFYKRSWRRNDGSAKNFLEQDRFWNSFENEAR